LAWAPLLERVILAREQGHEPAQAQLEPAAIAPPAGAVALPTIAVCAKPRPDPHGLFLDSYCCSGPARHVAIDDSPKNGDVLSPAPTAGAQIDSVSKRSPAVVSDERDLSGLVPASAAWSRLGMPEQSVRLAPT
jgi:hypothetical protein